MASNINPAFPQETDAFTQNMRDNFAAAVAEIEALQKYVPVGVIRMWPAETVPDGWLLCDGSEVSQTQYSDLFAVAGTWGSAGPGMFRLPDFTETWPVGAGSTYSRKDTVGENEVVLTEDELPVHGHTLQSGGLHQHTTGSDGGHTHSDDTSTSGGSHTHRVSVNSNGAHTHGGSTGTNGAHSHTSHWGDNGITETVIPTNVISSGDNLNTTSQSRETGAAGSHSHSGSSNTNGDHSHTSTLQSAGAHTHTVSMDSVPDHTHSVPLDGTHSHTLASEGGGEGHNNQPRYMQHRFIIKT